MKPKRPLRKLLMRGLLITLGLVFVPYGASRLLSPGRAVSRHSNPDAASPGPATTNTLRLACYNIAHGRGDGPDSRNWTGESRSRRLQRLDAIAQLLREANADIVVLSEVDFDSSWSHGVDQARELATRAGYPYWVEQRNLDVRFLFWKWRFGNAVLSKHPITSARIIDLPGYSPLETLLAGKKRGVLCEVEIDGETVRIAGVHLCHRSESIRAQSAAALAKMASESANPFFVVGDLNSTPPEFNEGPETAELRNAIRVLDASECFSRLPARKPTPADMTFHSASPKSVIDWIMIPRNWQFKNYAVIPSHLSDHRLVCTEAMPGPAIDSDAIGPKSIN